MDRELLNLVVEELRQLRSEGVEGVSMSDETLRVLECAGKGEKERGGSVASDSAVSTKRSADQGGPRPPVEVEVSRESSLADVPEIALPPGSKREQWEWLQGRVLSCPVCRENLNPGKKIVFGVGNLDAELFFCGEAPGADEETQGEPFVGKAGELLNGMIRAMGLKREDVYIGNIMNWRPQTGTAFGNRPPTDEEMDFCLPYLKAQIEIIQPKVVVALGGTAAKGLLGVETKGQMSRLRGKWNEFHDTPLMVTYHPSYLLHQESVASKRKVWEDLLMVMEKLGMEITEKQRNFFLAAMGKS
ncbi:MAG: uracil-DNA glycosylase [Verrucomicrobiota bacterium]